MYYSQRKGWMTSGNRQTNYKQIVIDVCCSISCCCYCYCWGHHRLRVDIGGAVVFPPPVRLPLSTTKTKTFSSYRFQVATSRVEISGLRRGGVSQLSVCRLSDLSVHLYLVSSLLLTSPVVCVLRSAQQLIRKSRHICCMRENWGEKPQGKGRTRGYGNSSCLCLTWASLHKLDIDSHKDV